MPPPTDKLPVEAEVLALLPDRAIAYDLIYTPSPTLFLPLAAARGLQTFDGVEMLCSRGRLDWRFGLGFSRNLSQKYCMECKSPSFSIGLMKFSILIRR
jgi:shikimate 5-dehydrogenase